MCVDFFSSFGPTRIDFARSRAALHRRKCNCCVDAYALGRRRSPDDCMPPPLQHERLRCRRRLRSSLEKHCWRVRRSRGGGGGCTDSRHRHRRWGRCTRPNFRPDTSAQWQYGTRQGSGSECSFKSTCESWRTSSQHPEKFPPSRYACIASAFYLALHLLLYYRYAIRSLSCALLLVVA